MIKVGDRVKVNIDPPRYGTVTKIRGTLVHLNGCRIIGIPMEWCEKVNCT